MPTIKIAQAEAETALNEQDWSKLDAMTDDEIARQIADDPDVAPDMTEHLLARRSVNVAALRKRLDMTQAEFARAYRFSLGAVRSMEQGVRRPSGPVAAYLELIAANPDSVRRTLGGPARRAKGGAMETKIGNG